MVDAPRHTHYCPAWPSGTWPVNGLARRRGPTAVFAVHCGPGPVQHGDGDDETIDEPVMAVALHAVTTLCAGDPPSRAEPTFPPPIRDFSHKASVEPVAAAHSALVCTERTHSLAAG